MKPFSKQLLNWYDHSARQLPWRVPPHESKSGVFPNPYHIWLSEVMLQQTTVATVKSYFEKFLARWPGVDQLAAATQEDVLKEWAGLGYYSRARNLKACADLVVEKYEGRFPDNQTELKKLPGIGDYTSAAIAAIAFGEKTAVVDGNIERVVARYTGNSTPLPSLKPDCAVFMHDTMTADRPGDFAQAMMDLGATICTPRNPECNICPVGKSCVARQENTMHDLPVKAPKKLKPTRYGAAFVARNQQGAVWLVRRPEKGLLGGMSAVPTSHWTVSSDGKTGNGAAPFPAAWKDKGKVRHTFTHFHLELEVWYGEVNAPLKNGWWSPVDQIADEALPTLMRKVIAAATIGTS